MNRCLKRIPPEPRGKPALSRYSSALAGLNSIFHSSLNSGSEGALYAATGTDERITFIDTPQGLRAQYQYFTEARLERLRAAGYTAPFTSLEDGIAATVRRALSGDPTR